MQNKANPKLTNNVFVQERFVMDDAQKKLLNKFDFVKAKDQSQFQQQPNPTQMNFSNDVDDDQIDTSGNASNMNKPMDQSKQNYPFPFMGSVPPKQPSISSFLQDKAKLEA